MSKQTSNHGVFSTVRETDQSFTTGSPAFDRLHRNRLEFDRQKLLDQVIRAYRLNPLCRRIVKLYRYFALGTDVEVEIKEKPSNALKRFFSVEKLGRTQRFLYDFWSHPVNRLDEQIPEWFDERTLTGELYLLFTVDAAGMCLVRAVPAEKITAIECAENDYRQELRYHTGSIDGSVYPESWEAWKDSDQFSVNSDQKTFMRHYVINRPVGSTWGESDLFPLLPWLARYTGWLENRATLNYWRQVFVWSVKGQYKSSEDREARQKELEARPPKPGAVLVGDETETWEAISPKLDSFEANADGLAIKKQIAAGAGVPMHFLAEPESSTRTTAEAAGTPTFKNFLDYQNSFFSLVKDVVEIACAVRRQVDPQILTHPEVVIHGQDISERDNPALAMAFQRAVQATGELYDRRLINSKEFLRTSYQFGGLVFDETQEVPEGFRRPLSNKVNKPSIPQPQPNQMDPKSGDVIEPSHQ